MKNNAYNMENAETMKQVSTKEINFHKNKINASDDHTYNTSPEEDES